MLVLSGTANGSDMTVRALGFIIAGHQMHHLKMIKERYL
ncbi:MAG: DinB family protein, partial [Lutibacter sp.]|nr:DinB family protein [Lutibacter sp.]